MDNVRRPALPDGTMHVIRVASRTNYLQDGRPERTQAVVLSGNRQFDFDSNEHPEYFFKRLSHPAYDGIRETVHIAFGYLAEMYETWRTALGRFYGRPDRPSRVRAD